MVSLAQPGCGVGVTPASSARNWLLLAFLSVLWGTAFQFNKLAVEELSPDVIVAVRLVGAAAILVVASLWNRESFPGWDRRWIVFGLMALFGNALPFWLISWGQQTVDSGVAGVLMATMPLATLGLAHFYVEGEKLSARGLLGFCLGFAVVVLLIGPDALSSS